VTGTPLGGAQQLPLSLITNRGRIPARVVANTGTTGGGTAKQFQQKMFFCDVYAMSLFYLHFKNLISNSGGPTMSLGPSNLTLRMGLKQGAPVQTGGTDILTG
jgi:hypothetical protein